MTVDDNIKDRPPRKKPLWPWLLLLVLTLAAIYSWNKATELFDDFSRDMPAAVIELFNDLLRNRHDNQREGPALNVVISSRVG
ncbi:hypothetical protein RMR10_007590 [Agrobacterium rosae]|uniref:hypothetical protein n=1 Tax=Agrobacterium rosae TaxID=1972867 RepID=UPI002A149B8C|nr:hypothetical protein [Agrobacterium rosae]MDX8313697.1 hypothetical protein [Agrobacterium rosae]